MVLKVIHSSRNLTGHAGLLAIGHCLNQFAQIAQVVDPVLPMRTGISNADVLRSYVGLLSMGKSDFDAIENHREDDFFQRALGLNHVPSSATMRQRLDDKAPALLALSDELTLRLLKRSNAPITPLAMGHVALDIDVFCMDNSDTKKEGVSRTYAGFDGYAPIAAYLGNEGWCLAAELREGRQHSAGETHYTLQRVLPRAVQLTAAPILLRMDSGFDSKRLVGEVLTFRQARLAQGGQPVDVLVKWNPRKHGRERLLEIVQSRQDLPFVECRDGKRQARWSESIDHEIDGVKHPLQRHYRVTERTIDKHGQQLLIPDWETEGWVTSLDLPTDDIIALYADHGTHEQFHSEFKTDMDLERLPSGKFATNDAVLSLAVLAYNCLRLIGQNALLGPDSPVRHPAKRRRLRTVIQEIIYRAALVIRHARQTTLDMGSYAKTATAFGRLVKSWRIQLI